LNWPVAITVLAAMAQLAIITTKHVVELRSGLAVIQALAAIAIIVVVGVWALRRSKRPETTTEQRLGGVLAVLFALGSLLMAPVLWVIGMVLSSEFLHGLGAAFAGGGAWGRPLRVRGKQVHPELCEGTDWARGNLPNASALDPATRAALEALWLHDAQKEHASVPAFARISWLLAAVGAPADLSAWSLQAAQEEVEHTRLCFALAQGYGGRSHTVEPMPELAFGMGKIDDPLLVLAIESLKDGCQLEDFNADVALACSHVCQEPVTQAVLLQIAREERSHAEFSWTLLHWLIQRDPARVLPGLQRALKQLDDYPRPTAATPQVAALIAQADPEALLAHGRLPDARWKQIWDERLLQTRQRYQTLTTNRNKPINTTSHRTARSLDQLSA
jgi:hypothetical protein